MRAGAIQRVGSLLKLGPMSRSRDWLQVKCPFAPYRHAKGTDGKPSFGIRVNNRGASHFYCFTCHASGPVSYLPVELARAAGKRSDKAMQTMLEILSIEADEGFGLFDDTGVQDAPPEPLDERAYGDIFPPVTDHAEALAYLEERGVDEYAYSALDLRFDPEEARIVFPVRDLDGKLYGYTGRTVLPEDQWPADGRYRKSKDYLGLPKRAMLLGAQLVDIEDRSRRLLIVEGPFDCAVALSHLADKPFDVVAVLGSVLTHEQEETVIEMGKRTYMMFDNDEAGDFGLFGDGSKRGAVARLLPEVPVYVPEYPEGEATDVGGLARLELLTALRKARPEA